MNNDRRYHDGYGDDHRYQKWANRLGWLSIGIGLTEIAKPGAVASLVGIKSHDDDRTLLRFPLHGWRGVAAGAGILMQPQTPAWLWGRVAGDLVDLTSLATAMTSERNDRKKVAIGLAAVLGMTALDLMCVQAMSRPQSSGQRQMNQKATESVIVNKSPQEVYQFWHDFSNLPTFMKHLESVRPLGDGRSRWCVAGPAGSRVEWDAETIADEPNQFIRWRSVAGADVANSGAVHFHPGPAGRGTTVKVELHYDSPGGAVGSFIAKAMGKEPGQMLYDDLRAFKQIMETGEVMKSDASIHDRMHAARPPEHYGTSVGAISRGREQA